MSLIPASLSPCPSCGVVHGTNKKVESATPPLASWATGIDTDKTTSSAVLERLRKIYSSIASPRSNQASIEDLVQAKLHKASLLYGEVQTAGVTRLLDRDHLDAHNAQRVVDLGMGCGRLAIQMALQFSTLDLGDGNRAVQRAFPSSRHGRKTLVWRRSGTYGGTKRW